MEEYVTRHEFLEFKRQVEQRQTDEMKAINVNVGSQDVLDRLDRIERRLEEGQRELKIVSDTWLDTLQEHYTEHKEDIRKLELTMATMKEDIIDAIRKYSQPGKN
jgi:phage shock protein A